MTGYLDVIFNGQGQATPLATPKGVISGHFVQGAYLTRIFDGKVNLRGTGVAVYPVIPAEENPFCRKFMYENKLLASKSQTISPTLEVLLGKSSIEAEVNSERHPLQTLKNKARKFPISSLLVKCWTNKFGKFFVRKYFDMRSARMSCLETAFVLIGNIRTPEFIRRLKSEFYKNYKYVDLDGVNPRGVSEMVVGMPRSDQVDMFCAMAQYFIIWSILKFFDKSFSIDKDLKWDAGMHWKRASENGWHEKEWAAYDDFIFDNRNDFTHESFKKLLSSTQVWVDSIMSHKLKVSEHKLELKEFGESFFIFKSLSGNKFEAINEDFTHIYFPVSKSIVITCSPGFSLLTNKCMIDMDYLPFVVEI